MLTAGLLLALAAALVVVAIRFYRITTYWKRRGVPYESFLSASYTNLVSFRRGDVYTLLEEINKRLGPVYGTYSGFQPVLRVSSPEGMRDALIRCFSSNHERALFVRTGSPLWDNNILVLDYHRWKSVRHLSGQAFTSSKLKPMKFKIERVANRLADRLVKLADTEGDINPIQYAQGYTLDVIAAVVFSMKIDALEDPNSPFVQCANSVFAPSIGLTVLLTMPWLVKYLPFADYPTKSVESFFGGFTSTLIKQRRQNSNESSDPDILDLWLAEQKNRPELTDELIASQAFVFFVAGFETSAYTMLFTLYLLSVNPDVQELAYNDMTKQAKDLDNIAFEEYGRMKYIEACFLETLRLFPTDHILDRQTAGPCCVAGVSLDSGIGVQVPIPAVHRDPQLFPQPYSYRPQRFVEEFNPDPISSSAQLSTMMTFGDGPKGCMGRRLALLQLTIGLCAILRRVRLSESELTSAACKSGKLPVKIADGTPFLPPPKEPLFVKLNHRN